MSTAYEKALEAAKAADRRFQKVRKAFLAGEASEDDFCAAQLVYQAAQKEFDKAFADERDSAEEAADEVFEAEIQGKLFD